MISFLSVPGASKRALISPPSYYRLAADGLMPPVIKLAKSRSAVIEDELDAVLRGRAIGMSNEQIREMIQRMVEQRAELFGSDAA